MNPNVNNQPDLKLPNPSYSENVMSKQNESVPAALPQPSPKIASGTDAVHLQTAAPLPTVPQNLTTAGRSDVSQGTTAINMAVPAEQDGLDDFWLKRLGQVTGSTQYEPRTQAENLYKLKSEYLQARFGKSLKAQS